MPKEQTYKFCFGPWNISEGADPYGPTTRPPQTFDWKLAKLKELGFDAMMFHDDDAVPGIDRFTHAEALRKARDVKKRLDELELTAEFVAPRLWEDPRTVDGGYTSNDEGERRYAIERSVRAAEIARELGSNRLVLWLAREGTYIREAKDPERSVARIVEAIDRILEADPEVRILIEPKPNEPTDLAYLPTMGHAVATAYMTRDPRRVGALMESAHAVLAGLDPSDEMAFAMHHGKLWSVHLNDQNGLKYDQDKAFGSVDLRRAFNQVDVLVRNGYGKKGEVVGLDVKAMRTQAADKSHLHLKHSKEIFLMLVDLAHSIDRKAWQGYVDARDYEGLELFVVKNLMGER